MGRKRLIALAFLIGTAVPAVAADGPVSGPAQEGAKPRPDYHCPPTAYLNCMPPITADRREACSRGYIAWVQAHCEYRRSLFFVMPGLVPRLSGSANQVVEE
jgi:hypothetical protein